MPSITTCPNCKGIFTSSAKACPHCGQPFDHCPECGSRQVQLCGDDPNKLKCTECGYMYER